MAQRDWCYITANPNFKVKIDREDLEKVLEHKWRVTEATTGRRRVVTSWREKGKVKTITLGRFLMNPSAKKQVYPRRFNADLDYRKDNLIVCTLKERQRLLPKNRKKASSHYRGVSFSKSDSKWRAGIEVEKRSINLGHFSSEDEAAMAYNEAARKYFGPMAYQNQVKRNPKKRNNDD